MFLRRKFLQQSARSEHEAIEEHLMYLFSTRRGSSGILPHFGFTDTGYRTPAEMVAGLSAEIRENIQLFEPRLRLLEIDDQYLDDGSVQLRVHCRVRSTDERMQIVMGPQGNLVAIGRDEGVDVDG